MRFHRIKVTDWCGVAEREVAFDDGINVIVGKNEAGKSSLLRAIQHLFGFKSSSRNRHICEVQSVGGEAGPEVELEFSFNDYRVVYSKRWLSRSQTVLRVLAPTPDQWSGDEAHEKMEALLSEHCDLELWRALSIQQGDGTTQATAGATSLGRALEGRRGASDAAADVPGLCARVESVFAEYWTATELENKASKDAKAHLDECAADESELVARLKDLDADIQALDDRQVRIARERARKPELQADFQRADEALKTVEKLRRDVELERERVDAARQRSDQAAERVAARAELRAGLEKVEREVASATEAAERLASEVRALDANVLACETAERSTRKQVAERRAASDRALLEQQVLGGRAQLGTARSALEALRADKIIWETSEHEAAAIDVPDAVFDALAKAGNRCRKARAQLDAAGGAILISAKRELSLTLGDEEVHLAAGQSFDGRFGAAVLLSIPEVADIQIGAGASVGELEAKREAAEDALAALCREAGVSSVDDAGQRRARAQVIRGRAEDAWLRLEREAVRHLGDDVESMAPQDAVDGTLLVLEREESEIAGRVAAAMERFPADHAFPGSESAAESAVAQARIDEDQAAQALAEATAALAEVRDARDRSSKKAEKQAGRREALGADVSARKAALEEQERAQPDADLARVSADLERAWSARALAYGELLNRFETLDPEAVEARHQNAKKLLVDVERRIGDLGLEIATLEAGVLVGGGEGLHEKLGHAQSQTERARQSVSQRGRRAEAAKLLRGVVRDLQKESRQRYHAPLVDRMESFGRQVFGHDFRVELGDDLDVARRTLNGDTLEFKQLSTGAKEQLGVLQRLACARLVADDGGVPVVLDDVLGFSDPERRARMSVILGTGSEGMQVILLTADPERYAQVGGAKVTDL